MAADQAGETLEFVLEANGAASAAATAVEQQQRFLDAPILADAVMLPPMMSTPVSLGRLLGNALELDSFIENCVGEGYRLTLNADHVLLLSHQDRSQL